MAKWFVIDESRKIEGIRGSPTKKSAEEWKKQLIESRSRRGEGKYNREFGRSKNLRVVKEGRKDESQGGKVSHKIKSEYDLRKPITTDSLMMKGNAFGRKKY